MEVSKTVFTSTPLLHNSTDSSSFASSSEQSAHGSVNDVAIKVMNGSGSTSLLPVSSGSSSLTSSISSQTAENRSNYGTWNICTEDLSESSKDSSSTMKSRSSSIDSHPSTMISDTLSRNTDHSASNSVTTRSASNSLAVSTPKPRELKPSSREDAEVKKKKVEKWTPLIEALQKKIDKTFLMLFGFELDRGKKISHGIFNVTLGTLELDNKLHFKVPLDSNAISPSKEVQEIFAYIHAKAIDKQLEDSSIQSTRQVYQKMKDSVQVYQGGKINEDNEKFIANIVSTCSAAIKPEDETIAIHQSFVDIMTFTCMYHQQFSTIDWDKHDLTIGQGIEMSIGNRPPMEPRNISIKPSIQMTGLRAFQAEEHELEQSIHLENVKKKIQELRGRTHAFKKCLEALATCLVSLRALSSSSSKVSAEELQNNQVCLQELIVVLQRQEEFHKSKVIEENIKTLNESASVLKESLNKLEHAQRKLDDWNEVLRKQENVLATQKTALSEIQKQLDTQLGIEYEYHEKLRLHKEKGKEEYSVEKISQILLYVFFRFLKLIISRKGDYTLFTKAWLTAVRQMPVKAAVDDFALELMLTTPPAAISRFEAFVIWDEVGVLRKI